MKNCPRNIDKPITLLGLEVEELAVISIWIGAVQAVFNMFIAVITAIGGIVILKRLKKGKPPGYIQHLFYKSGISYPGLLPPVKKVSKYSPWKVLKKKTGKENIFDDEEEILGSLG